MIRNNETIIYRLPTNNRYLHDPSCKITDLTSHSDNINIPLVIDTEFTGDRRMGITVQIKGVDEATGKIYDHQDLQEYARVNNLKLRHCPVKHDL